MIYIFFEFISSHYIKGVAVKELAAEAEIDLDTSFRKVFDQFKSKNSTTATDSSVINSEKSGILLNETVKSNLTIREVEYFPVTPESDALTTRTPFVCQSNDFESKFESFDATSTHLTEEESSQNEILTSTHLTEEESSQNEILTLLQSDSNNPSKGNTTGSNGHKYYDDGSERNDAFNYNIPGYGKEKDSEIHRTQVDVFESLTHNDSSAIRSNSASEIIENLGSASTTVIFDNGGITSVEYSQGPFDMYVTKPNPILELKTLKGPNMVRINEWSFSPANSTDKDIKFRQEKEIEERIASRSLFSSLEKNECIAGICVEEGKLFINETKLVQETEFKSEKENFLDNDHVSYKSDEALFDSKSSTNIESHPSDLRHLVSLRTTESMSDNTNSNSSEPPLKFTAFAASSSSGSTVVSMKSKKTCKSSNDLFEKISDLNPLEFYDGKLHPVMIPPGVTNDLPYQTNKFYANSFLGSQTQTVYIWPYEIYWDNNEKNGLAIQYPDPNRKAFGGKGASDGSQYYWNMIRAPGLFIGATSLRKEDNYLYVSEMRGMSVKIKLSPEAELKKNYIEFPLVEGMGLVTSIYHGLLLAKIQGNGGISNFTRVKYANESPDTMMYRVEVGIREKWLILIKLPEPDPGFELRKEEGEGYLVGSKSIDGLIIQVALAPPPEDINIESIYYGLAGQYVVGAKLSGIIDCDQVDYKISYETEGSSMSRSPLSFALPHHIALFDDSMKDKYSKINLSSTTKGVMQGFVSAELLFSHKIDNNVQWMPYLRDRDTVLTYKRDQIELIRSAAVDELKNTDIAKTVLKIDSQYFMGKAVDKYAYIMYVLHDIVKDEELADQVLTSLKMFFEQYKAHKNAIPLFYDTKFKGVTSEAAFTAPGEDFGSGYYNDHNFHYSYIIHAAALIGEVDKQKGGNWVTENKDFINTLVRDVANPSEDDTYFPVFRSFDWFQGHSWAHGITEFADGKDLESSSEDVHFSYAMKLWGQVSGDLAMEARGDVMLSIQTKAFESYFLYKNDNTIVPKEVLKNKVAGIFFENKVDYNTWFGTKTEYKHGIQMVPITPALGSVRSAVFAEEEWCQVLADLNLEGPWAGILNANRVFFDPAAAWDYFANPNFNYQTDMDDGQSRAWALAFSAPFKNEVERLSLERSGS